MKQEVHSGPVISPDQGEENQFGRTISYDQQRVFGICLDYNVHRHDACGKTGRAARCARHSLGVLFPCLCSAKEQIKPQSRLSSV